ncbi:ATP synthase F1 subunit epsilon [Bartonella bovis]|uniref:ATP synthase F1 subunit epsilon n=1 Tax=Bartonella bovis TaxID=155194 RepID=UPI000C9AD31E|nr:ATP synthase F1 subunit epsilon [Bartonella bovis]
MENNRAKRFLFELISPEKLVFSDEVISVVLPSASGYLTVMANHAPLMVCLMPGSIRVLSSSGEKLFALCGGVANITPSKCSLLAEAVVSVDHLSFDDLEQRILKVRTALEEGSNDGNNDPVEEFLHQLTTVGGVLTAV